MDMEICGNLMGQSREQSGNPPPAPTSNSNSNNSNVWWGNDDIWEVNEGGVCLEPQQQQQQQPEAGHHVMCLKLGKRHYFEDATLMGISKRSGGKPTCLYPAAAADAPRCQVEACHVPLLNAKDYHRRHRVCEMHSKAPKVVLLGLHQRFCQQCSRFHVISEFDDSKRSCRRRLAGHNQRRRKTTHSHESLAAPPPRSNAICSQSQGTPTSTQFPLFQLGEIAENKSMRGGMLPSPTGRALSLLSSNNESWATSSDLSLRSSAALRELIAENRAAILARQLILNRGDCWQPNHADDFGGVGFHQQQGLYYEQQQQQQQHQHGWERLHDENGVAHVTLDLMQPPNTAFGLLSVRGKSKEEVDQQECCHFWNSFQDHHSHVL